MKNNIVYLPKGIKYSCRFPASSQDSSHKVSNKERLGNYYVDGSLSPKTQKEKNFYNALYVGFDIYNSNFEEITLSDEIKTFDFPNNESFIKQFQEIASLSKYGHASPVKLNITLYELLINISETLLDEDILSQKYSAIHPAIQYLSSNDICDVTVAMLANVCGISVSGFRNLFKDLLGVSPIDYILNLRAQKAKNMLQSGEMTVTEVSNNMNFNDIGYFSRFYKKHFGHSPSKDMPSAKNDCVNKL